MYAAGDAESFILDDTRALAFSDIAMASLSGREGETLSGILKETSFAWSPAALSAHLLGKSSARATTAGSEQSERTRAGLGWGLDCLFSPEGLRFFGNKAPLESSETSVWLLGLSLAVESWASTRV